MALLRWSLLTSVFVVWELAVARHIEARFFGAQWGMVYFFYTLLAFCCLVSLWDLNRQKLRERNPATAKETEGVLRTYTLRAGISLAMACMYFVIAIVDWAKSPRVSVGFQYYGLMVTFGAFMSATLSLIYTLAEKRKLQAANGTAKAEPTQAA